MFWKSISAFAIVAATVGARPDPAHAQDYSGPYPLTTGFVAASLAEPVADGPLLPAPAQIPLTSRHVEGVRSGRSALLSTLYVSTALTQGLDLHSTYHALNRGAVEANPVVSGITRNAGAFVATKAAIATATILAARQVAKHNKLAAILTLAAVNSAYAIVVDHNYRVARGLR